MTQRNLAVVRDRAPIDQQWIQWYCDEFLKIAPSIPEGSFRAAVLRRVECCMDLLDAWQTRNNPMEPRS
jgi:hypothetical protein